MRGAAGFLSAIRRPPNGHGARRVRFYRKCPEYTVQIGDHEHLLTEGEGAQDLAGSREGGCGGRGLRKRPLPHPDDPFHGKDDQLPGSPGSRDKPVREALVARRSGWQADRERQVEDRQRLATPGPEAEERGARSRYPPGRGGRQHFDHLRGGEGETQPVAAR